MLPNTVVGYLFTLVAPFLVFGTVLGFFALVRSARAAWT